MEAIGFGFDMRDFACETEADTGVPYRQIDRCPKSRQLVFLVLGFDVTMQQETRLAVLLYRIDHNALFHHFESYSVPSH